MAKQVQRSSNPNNRKQGFQRRSNEDYVDRFRWGFVEDGETNENTSDYRNERNEKQNETKTERQPERQPVNRESKKQERKSKPEHDNADRKPYPKNPKDIKESKNFQDAKNPKTDKQPLQKKVVAKRSAPLSFLDKVHAADTDDLKLPSYGRFLDDDTDNDGIDNTDYSRKTTTRSAAKSVAPVGARNVDSARKPTQRNTANRNTNFVRDTEHETNFSARKPLKKQVVWDAEKLEYVPLEVVHKVERDTEKQESVNKNKENKVRSDKGRNNPVRNDRVNRVDSANPTSNQSKSSKSAVQPLPRTASQTTPLTENEPIKKRRPQRKKVADFRNHEDASLELNQSNRAPVKEDVRKADSRNADSSRNEDASRDIKIRPERVVIRHQKERGVIDDISELAANKSDPRRKFDPADVEGEPNGFAEIGVSEAMLEALKTVQYVAPTPIQAGVFKKVREGVDLMGQAQTGSGKTAAFSIPIIDSIENCPSGNDPVALILVPTRELAVQVRDEAERLSYGRDIRVQACYGGKPLGKQIERLSGGVDIVVGTPGRILDLMRRGVLRFDVLRWVVLDEADRMLDIGFRPDIEKILRRTPQERQTLLFSATLPAPVVRLAERYMKTPEVLDFSDKNVTVETIEQYYVTIDSERKFEALVYLLNEQQPQQAIIFVRTKRGADRLSRLLMREFARSKANSAAHDTAPTHFSDENHFAASAIPTIAAIHGDLPQGERDNVMAKVRNGKLRYLVATDVVGRGIDVSGISHIINYDIPKFCDDYVHRVGRTGRMGREGVAYTFVTVQEGSELTKIEMRINKLLKRAELKGFEALTPVQVPETPSEEDAPKPVFGKRVRRERNAL